MNPTVNNLMVSWYILVTVGVVHLPRITDASLQYYTGSLNTGIAGQMTWMENRIRTAVDSDCSIQVRNLVTYIETIWWPHLQSLATTISPEEQQEVLRNYARLQYMIGMRKCESDRQTFYQGQCYNVGAAGNPCPRNQQLYDRPADNMGYCYCQRGLSNYVYANGQCYQENEQGPCENGEWLIVNQDRTPSCQQAPRSCPADGQHIYWGCGINTQCHRQTRANTVMKCSRVGSKQRSCGPGAKLYRSGSTYHCGWPGLTPVNVWMAPKIALPWYDQRFCPSSSNDLDPHCRPGAACAMGQVPTPTCTGFRDSRGRCRKFA